MMFSSSMVLSLPTTSLVLIETVILSIFSVITVYTSGQRG